MSVAVEARGALLRHAAAMGGHLVTPLVPGEQDLMAALVCEGVFEFRPRVPGISVDRYALTAVGQLEARGLT